MRFSHFYSAHLFIISPRYDLCVVVSICVLLCFFFRLFSCRFPSSCMLLPALVIWMIPSVVMFVVSPIVVRLSVFSVFRVCRFFCVCWLTLCCTVILSGLRSPKDSKDNILLCLSSVFDIFPVGVVYADLYFVASVSVCHLCLILHFCYYQLCCVSACIYLLSVCVVPLCLDCSFPSFASASSIHDCISVYLCLLFSFSVVGLCSLM